MKPSKSYRIVRFVVLAALAFFSAFPLYSMISSTLISAQSIELGFSWIPRNVSFHAYVEIWQTIDLGRYLFNSSFVALTTTLLALLLGLLAAFPICRRRFHGKQVLLYSALITQTFPGILFLLPLFVLYASIEQQTGLALDGSYLGLIITYLSFSLPFCIWLMVGYLSSIPVETEQAAMTDGCGALGAFLRITLRMAVPGVIAVGVFTFINCWSEVLFASVLTSDQTQTLPIGLELFENGHGTVQWNQLMAATLTISVPVVVVFLWLQRYFVRGLSAGAVKS